MIQDKILLAMQTSKDYETMSPMAICIKIQEELGEVAEQVLEAEGHSTHKPDLEEELVDEVADVMIACCNLLTASYPDLSTYELRDMLEDSMEKKIHKYRTKVLGLEK